MASKASSASHKNKPSSSVTNLTAIDTSGCIGSLYDGWGNHLLEKMIVNTEKVNIFYTKKGQCKLINGKTDASENILRMIGIEDDLRLSILLNLGPRTELDAFIDCCCPINKHTRLLRYTYIYREENLSDDMEKVKKYIKSPIPQTDATHIITGVTWGIDVVVVLQLPSETELVNTIDMKLEQIRKALDDNHSSTALDRHNLDKLNITSMKVYSNIPILTRATSLSDVYQKINQFKVNYIDHRPVTYTLRSIQEIYSNNTDRRNTTAPLDPLCTTKVEQYFLQMSASIKYLELYLIEKESTVLRRYFMRQLYDIHMRLIDIKKKYTDELDRFGKLLIGWRRTHADITEIEMALNDEQQKTLRTSIEELTATIEDLKVKELWITELQSQNFKYWNAAEHVLNQYDNEQIVEQILIKNNQFDQVLCTNDDLNKDRPEELKNLRERLAEQLHNNPNLRLVYADFSYCRLQLSNIIILPRDKMDKAESTDNSSTSLQPTQPHICATSALSSSDEVINIVLLGESGVGKSTFINAFVNYLKFETFKEAESSKPVVLIPVSFLTTVGDNFKECKVKFGVVDPTNNEDFDNPGQSVTQRCKSYVFELNRIPGKKLRIIDTPGFGDTRGLDQDDLNMQHILEYINNFTHLNAVCFLLKPNVGRLNNYFRTCVSQLLDLLGPNARQNIIFCFTNSRCTFYTPGDTARPLRTLLDSFPVKDIPFIKTNTFSFDSESFRYLVALQNLVTFSELDKNEYKKSWKISATESNRLIDYVCNEQIAYNIHNQWKSVKHAQIQIIHMIRPILETIRNTLRNIILLRMKFMDISIQLIPKGIDLPTTVCLSCKPELILVDKYFWINSTKLHGCLNKCFICSCVPDQHIPIDYILRYEPSNNFKNQDENKIIDQVSLLLNASMELARFLKQTAYPSKDDPFLVGLSRMIQEEKQICVQKEESNSLNVHVLEELKKLMNKYESRMNEMNLNQKNIELPVIYERIQITRNYSGVREQMNAVEKEREQIMQHYEHKISNDHVNTSNGVNTTI